MSDFYTVKDQTLRNINAKQYVSGQITIDMMEDISNLGITLIINNRPDYEEEGQESSEDLMKKADEGMKLKISKGYVTLNRGELQLNPSKDNPVELCD